MFSFPLIYLLIKCTFAGILNGGGKNKITGQFYEQNQKFRQTGINKVTGLCNQNHKKEGKNVEITFWPKKRLGKWSVGLSIAFVILILLKILSYNPMPTFSIAALGLAGFSIAFLINDLYAIF